MQSTLALNVAPPSDEVTSERFSADLIGDIAGALGVPVSRVRIGSMRAVPKAALQSRVRAGLLHEALIESGSSAARSEELLAEVLGPLSNEELAEVQRRFEHEHSRPLARAVALSGLWRGTERPEYAYRVSRGRGGATARKHSDVLHRL